MSDENQRGYNTTSLENCERVTVLVDTHAHLYPCYDLVQFFRAAFGNLRALAGDDGPHERLQLVLCITEQPRLCEFARLQDRLGAKFGPYLIADAGAGWVRIARTKVEVNANLWLIHGAQYRAAEGFEVLSPLVSGVAMDGQPAREIIEQVLSHQAPAVLPWSFGKWLGTRGCSLRELLVDLKESRLLVSLGDIPLRRFGGELGKTYCGLPSLFGSDPLPWEGEEKIVGSLAIMGQGGWHDEQPIESVRELLSRNGLQGVGRRNSIPRALYRLVRANLGARTA